ncbi:hypothetical protein EWM64_g10149, partial [Hericium alpestre]
MAFTKFTFALVALLAASPLALAAPVTVDNSTLISNGQLAQQLNAEFQNLTTSDACNTGEEACIKGQFATCNAEKWQTQRCAAGSCFALPNIRSDGVFVACTSQRNAESIIASTGVQGGVAITLNTTAPFPVVNGTGIADGSNSTSTGDDQEDGDDDDCDDGNDSGNTSGTGNNSTVTITSFITVPLTGTATFVTTDFIFPSDASSILASATPIPTDASASATASASDSASATDSAIATASASDSASTTGFATQPTPLLHRLRPRPPR